MERSLIFMILGLAILWLIFDEIWGKQKVITKAIKGILGDESNKSLLDRIF